MAELRVPDDAPIRTKVPVRDGATKPRVKFSDLVEFMVEGESRFNADGPGIRAGARLQALRFEAGQKVTLRKEDLQRLHEALEKPSCGYPVAHVPVVMEDGRMAMEKVLLGPTVLPFIDAVAAALEPPPEAPAGPAKAKARSRSN